MQEKKKIMVKQVKSLIGVNKKHKRTIFALGLGRIGKKRIHDDTPQIRGMIKQVQYLLEVKVVDE